MFRQRLVHLLLALLLLSQYAGMAHVISHVASDISASRRQDMQAGSSGERHLPGDMQCVECLSFNSFTSTLPSLPPCVFVVRLMTRAAQQLRLIVHLARTTRPFNSRAPPALFL